MFSLEEINYLVVLSGESSVRMYVLKTYKHYNYTANALNILLL